MTKKEKIRLATFEIIMQFLLENYSRSIVHYNKDAVVIMPRPINLYLMNN